MTRFSTVHFRGLLLASTAAMAVDFLMSLTDRVIAGNLLGEKALAGLGLCTAMNQFALFVTLLVAMGASIRYLSAVGRFDEDGACRVFGCGLIASVGVGVLLAAGLLFGGGPYLGLFSADAATLGYASDYWRWFAVSQGLLPLQTYLLIMVYSDGDESTCLAAYPVQLGVNALASWLLCRAYGATGCALGTLCGYLAASVTLAYHFLRPVNALRFRWWFSFRELWAMVKSCFADSAVRLCWAVMSFVICRETGRVDPGMLPVAAAVTAFTGLSVVFDGVPEAAQPLLEVYYGEKNFRRVRTLMRTATKAVVVEGLVMTAVAVAAPRFVLRLIGIDNPEILDAAASAVRIVGLSMVFWALAAIYNSYYQYIERPVVAGMLVFMKDLLMPLAAVLLGVRFAGLDGLWAGYSASAPIALLLFAAGLRMRFGADRFPLLVPRSRDAKTFVWDLRVSERGASMVSRRLAVALKSAGAGHDAARMAPLIVEETLMLIRERNGTRKVMAEVMLDLNERPTLIIRDDGEIFDLTDADQRVASFRTYLVAELMHTQKERRNLTTTGFNRNRFVF